MLKDLPTLRLELSPEEQLAKEAYQAYGDAVEWKNYQGLPMPRWEHLTDPIRNAWIASATYVKSKVKNEKP